MEIKALIKKMKDINQAFIDFIKADDDYFAFENLIKIIEEQKIFQNKDEVRSLFQFISSIADNYHRTSNFFDKLEKIFQNLLKDSCSSISYFIPDYTKYNKRLLFLLLEKKLLKLDESFLEQYFENKNDDIHLYYYLYPAIKENLDEEIQKEIEEEILNFFNIEEISIFKKKCEIGENDSYICSLIRSDSVEDFIAYVNRKNIHLLSTINGSIYETNSFLINNEPSLIEYAAFFGSIQIIQYLKYSNVPLISSLWSYVIHSKNAELIHFLEENDIKPKTNKSTIDSYDENIFDFYDLVRIKSHDKIVNNPYDEVLIESIKCHHNDISNYIKDNFYESKQENDQDHFYDIFNDSISNSLNFLFIQCDIDSLISSPMNQKGFKLNQLCFTLTTIVIPSSITSIGDSAFYACSSLMQITIPSSVTSIGNYAFNGCSSLTQITIPPSVNKIGNGAFNGITVLEIKGNIQCIINNFADGCSSLTQITIPPSVKKIGEYAFFGCSSLIQIAIPSSINEIENSAFEKCSNLKQITFFPSVTSNEDNENIQKDTYLEELKDDINVYESSGYVADLPLNSNSYSSSCTVDECSSLTQITTPSSRAKIGLYAFTGCSSLEQIAIPPSIASIESNAFKECLELRLITIPSSVTSIGSFAFFQCLSLKEISIPSSVTEIEEYTFSYCSSLTQITIPSSIISIGNCAFYQCSSLVQITIPSSVHKIGNSAFEECSSLKQIAIPSSVIEIGDYAFNKCSSLMQITIPSYLKTEKIGLNWQTLVIRI